MGLKQQELTHQSPPNLQWEVPPLKLEFIKILPFILDIMSATLFWHSEHRISAEITTSWTCSEQIQA